ncbi:MAG: hypothetical protein WCA59_00525 [Candidatus Binataceae bacterium]
MTLGLRGFRRYGRQFVVYPHGHATTIASEQGAKSFERRAMMSLTRLLAKQDRREEALAMLAVIYGWFTEDFDSADLKDAKGLLDKLVHSLAPLAAGQISNSTRWTR